MAATPIIAMVTKGAVPVMGKVGTGVIEVIIGASVLDGIVVSVIEGVVVFDRTGVLDGIVVLDGTGVAVETWAKAREGAKEKKRYINMVGRKRFI